jgi:hypothetical protein
VGKHRLFKVYYWLGCTVKATLSLVMVNRENFSAHLQGPAMKDSIDDYFTYLKWEYKAGRQIDPHEAREKLAELMFDRGVNWS